MLKPFSLAAFVLTLGSAVLATQSAATPIAGLVAVRLETAFGNVDLAIDTVRAPITAANFLKYVDAGFYDGGRFHRTTRPDTYNPLLPNRPPMEIVQAGPRPGITPFPPIPLERTTVTGIKHVVGVISMARGGPDTATGDFFIMLDDQPSLDMGGKRFDDAQGAAAFGHVTAGLDVVRKIHQQAVGTRTATADNPLSKTQTLTPPIPIAKAHRLLK
jgi:peptidyl-prolyl cis-trans isomerase A (cyclophilin A)